MTKKDYELIARAIKEARQFCSEIGPNVTKGTKEGMRTGIGQVEFSLSKALGNENPRFDKKRFYKVATDPKGIIN